ncbi:STAS domain-containing protein [Saccharothrix algeriensis]|uniref:Anti-sigma factor antagonist n=1 Tax=Saccharothrix algeriensis TaxID=173560 RepID=A0A8T8HX42_9PSEU|nr:STAS domain-containing protein [Saccharothrix algeriensis]MBM7814797.1 anti-anti-sigma factor [Saccharothrix algeriensis]QTR03066.1 STAS domain-containing protein [Saccharothrix algeriensis]
MSPLAITTRDTATGPVLHVAGDLDHGTADELRALAAALPLRAGQRLVLDLSRLRFCDSSGLTALLAARNLALAARADIALAAVPARTLRTIRLVGLDRVFALYPDTAAALTA